MLSLESFTHRAELVEILSRWVVDLPQPGDLRMIKSVVNLNSYIARIWTHRLMLGLLRGLHEGSYERRATRAKADVKDFVVNNPTYSNSRIDHIIGRYKRFPEDFYRDTPIDGAFYLRHLEGREILVGCTRIKRFRRVAEKGSRRMVDFLFNRILDTADRLANERARNLGVAKHLLTTPPDLMVEEFAHAERRVIKSIRRGTIHPELPILSIPDMAGIKLIIEDDERERFLELLRAEPECRVVELEEHKGIYNATNLKVMVQLPRELLLSCPPRGAYRKILTYRGFDEDTLDQSYQDFLCSGEPEVMVEIILSTFQEYLESEIGRCMHEERLLSQRSHPGYNGHLATNIRYLMDYILSLCRAPGMDDVQSLPIKLWVRYIPDTISQLVRDLCVPQDLFFDNILEPPPCHDRLEPGLSN